MRFPSCLKMKFQDLDLDAFAEELKRQGYGEKKATLYDISNELNNRFKDPREPLVHMSNSVAKLTFHWKIEKKFCEFLLHFNRLKYVWEQSKKLFYEKLISIQFLKKDFHVSQKF